MGLDGLDYGPAYDIRQEQGKREAKAHKDSEQNGGGWTGLSCLDTCRHGVDRFVEDGPPDIAGKRLHGVESERSCGEGHDCLVCSSDFVARLMERCGGNGCGGQDKGYDGSGLVGGLPERVVLAICR